METGGRILICGVMVIYVQVALAAQLQRHARMLCKGMVHLVKRSIIGLSKSAFI